MPDSLTPWAKIPPTGPLLSPPEAAQYLNIGLSSYYKAAKNGELPKPLKIGIRASGIPKPWLDAVIAEAANV